MNIWFHLVVLAAFQVVRAEIVPLSIILDASSDEVHYIPGWLEAPATIDMSQVTFLTSEVTSFIDDMWNDDEDDDDSGIDDSFNAVDDDSANDDDDDQSSVKTEPTSSPTLMSRTTSEPSIDSGLTTNTTQPSSAKGNVETVPPSEGNLQVETPTPSPTNFRKDRGLAGTEGFAGMGGEKTQQVLDIVLFRLPDNCKRNRFGGCDWTDLGIGVRDEWMPGGVGYCCSEEAVSQGSCSSDQMGRLLIDRNRFVGEHKEVTVPTEPRKSFTIEDPVFTAEITGDYIILFSNCFDYGMDVFSMGTMETQTGKGYKLPGEFHNLMFFYMAMSVMYLLIVLWYWCGMRIYQDAAIPIQKFILATLLLGLLEFSFRAFDLIVWNIGGLRSNSIIWSAVVIGVMKRGITRCLFVMVSMGWGIVRDSLGLTLFKIVILGLLYCSATMLRDFLAILAVEKVESWSPGVEEEVLDLTFLATIAVVVINVIFFSWIISSLNATSEYLKNMNQTTKLYRHLRLRCIILAGFVIALGWFIFSIVDGVMNILTTNQFWVLESLTYVNNLFVLGSVAILWRPNSNAKDYAMQLQLATGDDDENDLELSCVVPSAGDLDGNDPDHPNGLAADHGIVS